MRLAEGPAGGSTTHIHTYRGTAIRIDTGRDPLGGAYTSVVTVQVCGGQRPTLYRSKCKSSGERGAMEAALQAARSHVDALGRLGSDRD